MSGHENSELDERDALARAVDLDHVLAQVRQQPRDVDLVEVALAVELVVDQRQGLDPGLGLAQRIAREPAPCLLICRFKKLVMTWRLLRTR